MDHQSSKLKKVGKGLLKILVGGVAVIAVLLAGIFIIHRVSLSREAKKIEDYGQKLTVFDSTMNVVVEGEGPETIVLLTGFGTSSPWLDFTPMIAELKDDYQVVTIEPFGYGLSGQTTRERNLEKMTEEIHEVVSQLNLDQFILMGHSIAGLYSLKYVNQYPDQVKAFVGIDSSVPKQPWPGYNSAPMDLLAKAGIMRAVLKVAGEEKPADGAALHRRQQMHMITMKNTGNQTLAAEASSLSESFKEAQSLAFPKTLPVLLFADEGSAVAGWADLHQAQADSVANGKLVLLKGSHYLHHTQSKRMAVELANFLSE